MLFRSNDTATTEIYTNLNTLSLHDALPISVWEGTCDRVAYPQAMGRGRSVVEMSDDKAAAEVESITENVINTFNHE